MAPRGFCFSLFLFVLFYNSGRAQTITQDSSKILHDNSIAFKIFLSHPDSSIVLASRAAVEATRIQNPYLEGFSYYILSKSYWAKANYKLSTEFGFKALQIFENSEHVELWGKTLLSLARTFVDIKNFKEGREYIGKAMALSKAANNISLLGETYREKSMLLSELKEYDSALYYSDRGISIFEKLKDSVSLSILYSRKGKIYFSQRNYQQSTYYNRKALQLDTLINNQRALGISYYQSALDAIHTNKIDSAIILLKKSIPVNQSMHNMSALIRVHNLLADIYIKQQKPELAVKELKLASQCKDSLYNTQKSGQIQEMQSLYELSSKEKTIALLEQENQLRKEQVKIQRLFVGILLLSVTLLGLVVFFLVRYKKLQEQTNSELEKKNAAIEQQNEEIQAQTEVLIELNDLKSKLFSVISHDLRGPMGTLRALLDLLSDKHLTPDEFITISDKLKTSLDVTQRTLENLLNWSLSQMEGMRTEQKMVNLHETIVEACHLMKELALRKNVSIGTDIDNSIFAMADEDQLQLILRNLIHNAIKFSKPYESVSVSAYKHLEFCVISVKDSGIGMTDAEVDKIISSRKQHFSKTGTMQEKGTGLGLLLCQEFIKLNGGDITIKSAVNQGTEVIFTLRLAEESNLIAQTQSV